MNTVAFYKGSCEEYVFARGIYSVSVWGAQGGICPGVQPSGFGGFSNGTMALNRTTTLIICVGGRGQSGTTPYPGGFNGGGMSKIGREMFCSGSGGGSSDIRRSHNISSRIIVAGGGGGNGQYYTKYPGGSGGGESGQSAFRCPGSGKGGTQLKGGDSVFYPGDKSFPSCSSQPGQVLTGGDSCATADGSTGGGGGGYYGGSGGADYGGGGGGSGFVNPHFINGATQTSNHTGDGLIIISPLHNFNKRNSCFIIRKQLFRSCLFSLFVLTSFT